MAGSRSVRGIAAGGQANQSGYPLAAAGHRRPDRGFLGGTVSNLEYGGYAHCPVFDSCGIGSGRDLAVFPITEGSQSDSGMAWLGRCGIGAGADCSGAVVQSWLFCRRGADGGWGVPRSGYGGTCFGFGPGDACADDGGAGAGILHSLAAQTPLLGGEIGAGGCVLIGDVVVENLGCFAVAGADSGSNGRRLAACAGEGGPPPGRDGGSASAAGTGCRRSVPDPGIAAGDSGNTGG